jgi:hypothetical protein
VTWIESINVNGYAIVDRLVDAPTVLKIASLLDRHVHGQPGVRNLLHLDEIRGLAGSDAVRSYVEAILGPQARPVRGILFDKTPETNWKVAWHQDLSIPVACKTGAPGYGPWSVKAGVVHVQPPLEVLESMLTVRLHLDDCAASNGPLRVIPGSHRHGVLAPVAIAQWKESGQAVDCTGISGSCVLMRPLILHASGTAMMPMRRRVVHIEYAAGNLPGDVSWFDFNQ